MRLQNKYLCISQIIRKKINASMTVEVSIVLPLFIFFVVNILSIILMFQRYSDELSKLHAIGRELSIYAYGMDTTIDSEDDIIKLVLPHSHKPYIPIVAFKNANLYNCCYMRAWTGYKVDDNSEDEEDYNEYVYVAQNASVYHKSRDCTHIMLSISYVSSASIAYKTNEYGELYHCCLICTGKGIGGMSYITNSGDKYHSSLSCSGLKRTIRRVKLGEVGELGPCLRCCN